VLPLLLLKFVVRDYGKQRQEADAVGFCWRSLLIHRYLSGCNLAKDTTGLAVVQQPLHDIVEAGP
jgi:hypothetical protein